jgi:hypothetical protein
MMRKSSFSFVLVAIVLAIISAPIVFAGEPPSSALRTYRVVAPINENQVVMLGGHLVPWATTANDLGVAAGNMKVELRMTLKRSDAQEAALQALLAEQQKPKSDNYRKWLTPEEYGAKFGISDSDLAKVTAWLTSHGFVVDSVAKGNNMIRFSGTHAQVQQALHTTLHQYKVGSEVHYANVSNPVIPAALAPVISGFHGLNDMKPKPLHTTVPKLATRKKGETSWHVKPLEGGSNGVTPQFEWQYDNSSWHLVSPGDFATIYNVQPVYDTYDGTGQTIAIVGESDILPRDVDAFRAAFGLPATKLNVIYDGPNPGLDFFSENEADLDVQWAGAIAKNATIDLVVSQDVSNAIFYAIDNNIAPVLSVSWGECELYLGSSGNTFISELYKQAASQGITVIAATGDSASAGCDIGLPFSKNGLSVSGFASTPYNVAVGGTDFPVNWMGNASTYWDNSNSVSDQHSALSYIPEAPWNSTCASSEVLALTMTLPEFAADTTNELLCNDSNAQYALLNTVGGSGGASNCTDTATNNPADCKSGYPQPSWQTGMTADSRRQIPDVSFFAGSGLWYSAYIFCESDRTPDGATCFGDNQQYNLGGGTSFSAPAFAGIVALLNQKTNSRLGNINYNLYDLAAQQFNDPNRKDACKVGDTTGSDAPGCVFHDLTQGNIRVPCWKGSVDNPPDGVCSPADDANLFGILSGYDAGAGFDMASGLGSINAFNLLNSWPADNRATTQTTLTLTASTLNYGTKIGGTVTVSGTSGTPSGLVTLMYKDASGNIHSGQDATELVNGTANLPLTVVPPAGNYTAYARYAGDDSAYLPSVSAQQAVTISRAVTTVELSASRTSVAERQSARLEATIKSLSLGDNITGTVTFKNVTTGAVIDTVAISPYTDAGTGYAYGQATTYADVMSLVRGDNQITATFSGDTNYLVASGSAPTIQYTGGFSISASSTSLTLSPGATSGNTVTVTLTPSPGLTLSPSSITLSCPGTLPAGVTCQFSAPTATPNGSVYSTLTFALGSPLAQNSPSSLFPHHTELATLLTMTIVGGVFVVIPRKRPAMIAIGLVLVFVMALSFGCGGGTHKATPPVTTTLTLSSSSMTPALNSPVTLTANVSNSSATGTVSFFDGGKLLGSTAVNNGIAVIATSSLPVGARSITATYSGDSKYPAATSSALAVDVTFSTTVTAQAVHAVSGNFGQVALNLTVK